MCTYGRTLRTKNGVIDQIKNTTHLLENLRRTDTFINQIILERKDLEQ